MQVLPSSKKPTLFRPSKTPNIGLTAGEGQYNYYEKRTKQEKKMLSEKNESHTCKSVYT